jgi:hypothetical protein
MTTKEPVLTDEEREEGFQFLAEVVDLVLTQLFRELPGLLRAEYRRQQAQTRQNLAYLTKYTE